MTTPAIWIADLAAYNAGHLHGKWVKLDADTTLDDLNRQVEAILKEGQRQYSRETLGVHEEFAIHDYECFGPIRIGEYDSLETVLDHAHRIGEEPNKYAAWISARGESDAENFDPELVHGPYESEDDYFDQYLDSFYGSMDLEEVLVNAGLDKRTAEALAPLMTWIDAERFTRDYGNLVEVSTGDYSREYYEVDES